jgi:hypothetical protein
MVASALALGVIITAVGSVVYYQRVSLRNDRVARLANLMESQMERILSTPWGRLENATNGFFPPGGFDAAGKGVGVWPSPEDTPVRHEAPDLRVTLVKDSIINGEYTGLSGTVQVFYTPYTIRHSAFTQGGTTTNFTVRYYKVELVVTLDEKSRVRSEGLGGADTWALVTYISELQGRNDIDFANRVLGDLRNRG